MSRKGKAATLILSALFLMAIAGGGYWLLQETKPKACPICARSIHPHSSAVVLIDKNPVKVCCIRFGITHNFQVGKPGEVVEVTDFLSDKPMKPDAAFYVEGSQVSMCDPHGSSLVDETKHPYNRIFDRFEPSTYAFAHREDAEAFMQQNGGKLLTWEELKKEVGVIQ
jgi:nitrous oxide reductase accessory protein NosL